jgi:hypothetical protein
VSAISSKLQAFSLDSSTHTNQKTHEQQTAKQTAHKARPHDTSVGFLYPNGKRDLCDVIYLLVFLLALWIAKGLRVASLECRLPLSSAASSALRHAVVRSLLTAGMRAISTSTRSGARVPSSLPTTSIRLVRRNFVSNESSVKLVNDRLVGSLIDEAAQKVLFCLLYFPPSFSFFFST